VLLSESISPPVNLAISIGENAECNKYGRGKGGEEFNKVASEVVGRQTKGGHGETRPLPLFAISAEHARQRDNRRKEQKRKGDEHVLFLPFPSPSLALFQLRLEKEE